MSNTEEVERVARALCQYNLHDESGVENDDPTMPALVDHFWRGYMGEARVAIAALRKV
jgi:hypothetical protein